MAEAVTLSLEALVTLEHDVEPYVMDWPDVLSDDGEPEAAVLIVSKRPGGFLAAVPVGFLHPLPVASDLHFTFDPDQPFAIPDPPQLLTMVRDWLSANASSTQAAYLSLAEEEAVDLEDAPLEEDRSVNTPPPRRARKAAPGKSGLQTQESDLL